MVACTAPSCNYSRAAVFVLNVRTLFMCALACAIVYLCESDHLDLRCAIWGVSLVLGVFHMLA